MTARTTILEADLVRQVPLFFGLTPTEMRAVVEICKLGQHSKDEIICQYGGSSGRMYVLLEGELEILAPDGTRLAVEKPVTTVGEMGFVSFKPRSATVKVHRNCRLLRLEQHDFDALAQRLPAVRAKIFRNVVRILADRLADANDLIARFKKGAASAPGTEAEEDPQPDSAAVPLQAIEPQDPATQLVGLFYTLAGHPLNGSMHDEDREHYLQLRRAGYSEADIEYAIKWTVRNIPAAQKFNLVRLSIEEAFEGRWSV